MLLSMELPIPRDLKDDEGWRFASFKNRRHPVILERMLDSSRGVSIQGFLMDAILSVLVNLGYGVHRIDVRVSIGYVFLGICCQSD